MENDDAIVGTIFNRREALTHIGRYGLGAVVGGILCASADRAEAAFQEKARREVKLVASPVLTEGPFFVDEKLKRADLLAGVTRATVAQGVPLEFAVRLYRLTGSKFAPLVGATVDVWHADAAGVYSDENVPMNHENTAGQRWLRGYQVSDKNGLVRFQTIFPGWYEGRTTHIHFKVRQSVQGGSGKGTASGQADQTKEFTSQLFFDDAVADRVFAKAPYRTRNADQTRNASDSIFGEPVSDGSRAGEHLMLNLTPGKSGGYRSALAVALTDENLRKFDGRGQGHGGPGGPPPGGFGGPDGPPPDGPPPFDFPPGA